MNKYIIFSLIFSVGTLHVSDSASSAASSGSASPAHVEASFEITDTNFKKLKQSRDAYQWTVLSKHDHYRDSPQRWDADKLNIYNGMRTVLGLPTAASLKEMERGFHSSLNDKLDAFEKKASEGKTYVCDIKDLDKKTVAKALFQYAKSKKMWGEAGVNSQDVLTDAQAETIVTCGGLDYAGGQRFKITMGDTTVYTPCYNLVYGENAAEKVIAALRAKQSGASASAPAKEAFDSKSKLNYQPKDTAHAASQNVASSAENK